MRKLALTFVTTLTMAACSRYGGENLKGFIEYGMESENYVRWAKDQSITWDLFQGDVDGRGVYNNYLGIYFFYDLRDGLRFNVTIYLDKKKSWVRPKEEWGASKANYDLAQALLKLKFDYYEYSARQLRKFLVENRHVLTDEGQLRSLAGQYYDKGEAEWIEIQNRLGSDLSETGLNSVRQEIDTKLEELKDFDTRVNSTFQITEKK